MNTASNSPPAAGSELSPVQAGLRFAIEMAAVVCWAVSGWKLTDGPARWLLAIALPVVAAALWGTFRAPGDHSANGGTPVAVPGLVRLLLELDILLGAAIVTAIVWSPTTGIVLAAAVVMHYAATLRRVRWLVGVSGPGERS